MYNKRAYVKKEEVIDRLDILLEKVEQIESLTNTTHPFMIDAHHDKITKKAI